MFWSTYNIFRSSLLTQYYRITALENKSSQGATLSPVKLWSGNYSQVGDLNITNAEKYSIFNIKLNLYGLNNVILVRGSECGADDDISKDEGCGAIFTIVSNKLHMNITRRNFNVPTILEVWGIG